MAKPSRREFLVVTGAGAAAAGALAVAPGAAADAAPLRAPRDARPLVVHVADPEGAELHIHSGERSSVVHDRDLVVRILRAAKEA